MVIIDSFEEEMAWLKRTHEHGSYEYCDSSEAFTKCTRSHFKHVKREKYGVYVVRQRDTYEVFYIGKGGTIDSQGQFKKQDIPGRLNNVKAGGASADEWYGDLFREQGPLVIEYIFLSHSKSPALIEALLLQAYFNENHYLPCKNKSL